MQLKWALMENNITQDDLDCLIEFLKKTPRLTQSENVMAFESEWSDWLGVKHSVYVNSGATANFISMMILKELYGNGEIIVPTLTWISDIASVIQAGLKPIFVDIDPDNLCMAEEQILAKINNKTKAVFMTYVQGFNGLSDNLLSALKEKNIPLIEDVCESHGATFNDQKLGSFGLLSNFSFYFAHHMSTIEGGMICTDDEDVYQIARVMRSHGMVRESTDESFKNKYIKENPQLSPDFIFAYPSFNFRGTEIGAVIGRQQIKRLDSNNKKRQKNFDVFIKNLDSTKYKTNFDMIGSCNYAFNLILTKPDDDFRDRLEKTMNDSGIEFRRGSSGGGNQMRQPYLKNIVSKDEWLNYPNVEHVHFYGYYIGNYPGLEEKNIIQLCKILNGIE